MGGAALLCPCGVQAVGRCGGCGRGLCWTCGDGRGFGHPGSYHSGCGPFARAYEDTSDSGDRSRVNRSFVEWFEAKAGEIYKEPLGLHRPVATLRLRFGEHGATMELDGETIVDVVTFLPAASISGTWSRTMALAVDAAGDYYQLLPVDRSLPRRLRKRISHCAERLPASTLLLVKSGGSSGVPEKTFPRPDAEVFATKHGWLRP